MEYLYKYKSGTNDDINALQKDSLWVSTYENMNDPMEYPIYVTDKSVTDNDIDEYKEKIMSLNCCISFSTSPSVKRLWNYYTNGFKGMVIAYTYQEIKDALIKNKVKTFTEDKVVYDGKKYEIFKGQIKGKTSSNTDPFFHKDDSWKEEKEYRFVFEYKQSSKYYQQANGFLLNNIKPHHIFIGYKINKANKAKLIDYCKTNDIYLYEMKPNNRSKNCADYNKKTLVAKKSKLEKEGNIYPSIIK